VIGGCDGETLIEIACFCVFYVGMSNSAAAYCTDPCRPYPWGRLNDGTIVSFTYDASMTDFRSTFQSAISAWSAAMSTLGVTIDVAEG
jgi:hypothetical protein